MARPTPEDGKVAPPTRAANRERRTRQHLTPQEVDPNAISACCSAAFHLEFHINVCQQRREHPTLGHAPLPRGRISPSGLVGPLPVRLVTEVRFENGLQNELERPLHHLVPYRRNPSTRTLPPRLGIATRRFRSGRQVRAIGSSRSCARNASMPPASIASNVTPSMSGAPWLRPAPAVFRGRSGFTCSDGAAGVSSRNPTGARIAAVEYSF